MLVVPSTSDSRRRPSRRVLGVALLAALTVLGCGGSETRDVPPDAGGARDEAVGGTEQAPGTLTQHQLEGLTMGTSYRVTWVGPTDEDTAAVQVAVDVALADVNRMFNAYVPDSVVSRLNASRSTEAVPVEGEFATQVARVLRLAAATEGAYDPTIRPLVRLMPFKADSPNESLPSPEAVRAVLEHVGFEKLRIEGIDESGEIEAGAKLRKLDPALELDPDSFAKGYGVDRVSDALAALGRERHLVEIGGEVRCRGTKSDGSAWRLGIEDPAAGGERRTTEIVELRDAALATSGDYRQFAESEGRRLHHILDPRTGENVPSPLAAVSVRAPDCALADALSTAFMVVGVDGLPAIEAEFGTEFSVLFLIRDASAEGGIQRRAIRW